MSAHDLFEDTRALVLSVTELAQQVKALESAAEPHGQRLEGFIGSRSSDAMATVHALILAREKLERTTIELDARLDYGTSILYGASGRGGLAKARSSTDADCICGYYLQGMTWREVADELARPESKDAPQWCKRRAYRALRYIDKVGVYELSKS